MSGKDNNVIDKSEYFTKVQQAIDARNKFLEEHPELLPFQKEIEKEMRKAGSWENRASILKSMMDVKMQEMKNKLLELQKIVNGTKDRKENDGDA